MKHLFFDIETIPCQNDQLVKELTSGITPPCNLKKQETIDKWNAETRPKLEYETFLKTSFSGLYGEIIVIGCAIDNYEPFAVSRDPGEPEKNMLARWWEDIFLAIGPNEFPLWIGHNVCEFDLRFLFHRCVINNIMPRIPLPYNDRPWSKNVYDTLYEFMGNNKSGGSLDAIAKALYLDGKTENMKGSDVWPEYQKGNINKIARYCIGDVSLTREIYKRLNFIDGLID